MALILFFFALVASVSCESCAYKGCHPVKPGVLNVHLMPHTHDDVGWLKTVDQYYYGSNKVHAPFGVQYILDSVVSELLKNKNRRFIYVESAFLWRWWLEQDSESRAAVLGLVREGRLQLVHGGWCMSDEAAPHYSMLVDQMTFGLKFLNETFGECGIPSVAWQIDPFGHSSEVALQFAAMGYDAVFFGRIDHEDYRRRVVTKQMEMIWRPDTSIGEMGEIFTGILFNLYMAPSGFCFDTYCSDEPIMDNPKLHGYNVNERINDFRKEVQFWADAYKTKHVQITMGGDFNYIVASSWFKNMDKLIKYINNRFIDMNVLYSTPACYLKALHEENITWPVKDDDDFFPYGSDEHTYWTGYFTSRPNFKLMVYRANNVLQAVKQLRTGLAPTELSEEETLMSRAMGIAQHHDAVSGTEKQHVSDDYALYISEGLDASEKIFSTAYRKWVGADLPQQRFCRLLNISQCEETEGATRFTVTVYNPLSRNSSHPIRVPVRLGLYKVVGPTGEEIPNELVPVPQEVLDIPGRMNTSATYELFFWAEGIPPLGILSFHVERYEGGTAPVVEKQTITLPFRNVNVTLPDEPPPETLPIGDIMVDNQVMQLVFNRSTGHLERIRRRGEEWIFHQNFFYYEGSKGYNYNSFNRASGAYIFRPAKDEIDFISPYANVSIFRGKQVIEVYQQFGPWVSQIVRLYCGKDNIEFNWLVGPIPVEKWIGKEVITRYTTQLKTNGTLWTDSNGRRMLRRVRNKRQSWNLTLTEPTASNYYPITAAASLNGNQHSFAVLTDRPQGAASLHDGQVEIMVHRRLLYDDSKGVGEPLDEMQFNKGLVARGTHVIQLSENYKPKADEATANASGPNKPWFPYRYGAERRRLEGLNLVYGPLTTFARTELPAAEWSKKYRMKYTGLLREPLPNNVHLLTLERWTDQTLLVRLEHLFEAHEHPELSMPATVLLKTLLANHDVTHAAELTLAANQPREKLSRLRWNHEGARTPYAQTPVDSSLAVELKPMEIRTFEIFLAPRKAAA